MQKPEHVLCIVKKQLPDSWTQPRTLLAMEPDEFNSICTEAGFQFVPRPDAEKDPSLKQIIPYIILQTKNLKKTAVYSRTGSEKRLHDLKSIGIGGHINPEDQTGTTGKTDPQFSELLMAGMYRELDEELIMRPENEAPVFAGIISEDLSDVGKVHLGAVFRLLTDTPEIFIPGEELTDFRWVDTSEIKNFKLELWSELALELLEIQ